MPYTAHRVPPTSEKWEARQGKITQLYLDDDEALTKVMADINKPGVFNAT